MAALGVPVLLPAAWDVLFDPCFVIFEALLVGMP
jgi:hypothetical protein